MVKAGRPQPQPRDAQAHSSEPLPNDTVAAASAHPTPAVSATGGQPPVDQTPQPRAAPSQLRASDAGSPATAAAPVALDGHPPAIPPIKPPIDAVPPPAVPLGAEVLAAELKQVLAASGDVPGKVLPASVAWLPPSKAASADGMAGAAGRSAPSPHSGSPVERFDRASAALQPLTQDIKLTGASPAAVDLVTGQRQAKAEQQAAQQVGLEHMYPSRRTLKDLYPDWGNPARWLPCEGVAAKPVPADEVCGSNI